LTESNLIAAPSAATNHPFVKTRLCKRSIDVNARTARFIVPGVAEAREEPIVNSVTKEQHRARFNMPNGFEPRYVEIVRLRGCLFPAFPVTCITRAKTKLPRGLESLEFTEERRQSGVVFTKRKLAEPSCDFTSRAIGSNSRKPAADQVRSADSEIGTISIVTMRE
jgi:hypothetical protein